MDDPFFAPAKPWIAPQCVPTKTGLISLGVVGGLILIYFGTFFVHISSRTSTQTMYVQGCCCSCVNFCLGKLARSIYFGAGGSSVVKKATKRCNRWWRHTGIIASQGSAKEDEHRKASFTTIPRCSLRNACSDFYNIVCLLTTIDRSFGQRRLKCWAMHFSISKPFRLALVIHWLICGKMCSIVAGLWAHLVVHAIFKIIDNERFVVHTSRMLNPRTRGRYFHMLDVMGKWSLRSVRLTQLWSLFTFKLRTQEWIFFQVLA